MRRRLPLRAHREARSVSKSPPDIIGHGLQSEFMSPYRQPAIHGIGARFVLFRIRPMNTSREKCVWLPIAMLILLGAYLFLNAGKLTTLPATYYWMINGSPAGKLVLQIPSGGVKKISLPSSDIIDADGRRQLVFFSCSPDELEAIGKNPNGIGLKLDGVPIAARPKEANGYLYLDLPQHKLFLVPDGKLKAVATILLQERAARKDLVHCAAGGDCTGVLVQFAGPA